MSKSFFQIIIKALVGSIAAIVGLVGTFVILIIVLVAVAVHKVDWQAQMGPGVLMPQFVSGNQDSQNQLLEIPVSGLILGERQEGDFLQALGGYDLTYGYEVKEQLRQASQMEQIKGVILNIQSPGGTVFGSKAIVDGIREYQETTSQPVLAYVGSVAASVGYWVASAADWIMADAGTTLGSIGVIAGPFKYYDQVLSEDGGAFLGGIVTQGGIESTYITAGQSKDLGNPYRRLTESEVAVLQTGVNNSYSYFVDDVAQGRKLESEFIRNQVRALVYDEQQAKELNLIDQVGSKQDAEAELAQLATLGNNYQVVKDAGSSSLLGDFGVALKNWSGFTANNSNSTQNFKVCSLVNLPLAYHGDTSLLFP